jgi:hypothetical protein
MNRRFQVAPYGLFAVSLLAFASCGKDAGTALSWNGTWVSSQAVNRRGAFGFDGTWKESTLSGVLTLDPGTSSQTRDAVTGEVVHVIGPPSYYTVDFATADKAVTFSASVYDALTSGTPLIGSYANTRTGDQGRWHTVLSDGVTEAPIDRAVPIPPGMVIHDLCFVQATLYATGTASGSSTSNLYEVDTSSGAFAAVAQAPVNPKGLAFDGTWVWLGFTSPMGSTLPWKSYDPTSWAQGTVFERTSEYPPAKLAFHSGMLWSAPRLGGSVAIADVSSEALTFSSVQAERAGGIDFVGDSLWASYFPPGGVWGTLDEHRLDGTSTVRFYSPENLLADTGALAAEGDFLWIAAGNGLYRLRIH